MKGIKDLIVKTLISAEGYVNEQCEKNMQYRNSCYELYGFDVLVDKKLKPWLLEVNTAPSLKSTSGLDKALKTSVYADLLNLVGFYIPEKADFNDESYQFDPSVNRMKLKRMQNAWKSIKKDKDKLQLQHKGLNSYDYEVLLEYEEEDSRSGDFERIFPNRDNVLEYSQLFKTKSYQNMLLWSYLRSKPTWLTTKFSIN
eukprot:CAMPEP_0115045720 /NCGR_PEP_ID=MMETSP0216-20121206/48309_1 /TAXON_ID=223996 /ORGANISM="Protocruzia adherens, Strain Boccale" /LENGTH=198 /DNA_ID=CAMNT_0002428639 /DNA_START=734 /DNA_END=1330 /DNA_ORIENTATION=-